MEVGGVVLALLGTGTVSSIVTWLLSRPGKKREEERQASSDARADWAKFAAEIRTTLMEERTAGAAREAAFQRAEAEARHRIDGLLARLDAEDRRNRLALDHIDVLEAHIWGEKPPPPPSRPEGL